MLKEQSITAENGEILVIDGSNVAADSLQNPSDPDATYRQKAGKGYTGYVLNTAEVRDVNRNVGIIMSHDYQKNIYSDAKFGRTFMEKDPLTEHLKQLSVDGAYFSSEMSQEAGEKGIELNLSNLTGRKVLKDVIGVEQFKRDTDTGVIIKCPAGHTPCESKRVEYKQEYHAKFLKKHCNNCPLKSKCQVKELKKYYSIKFSEKKLQIDQHRSRQGSKRHQELSSFRAGVEGIPSTLRRRYKIDSMPVRGYLRTKIWVNSKVAAYNIQMLLRYTGMAIQAA
jgi:hypothetical protein